MTRNEVLDYATMFLDNSKADLLAKLGRMDDNDASDWDWRTVRAVCLEHAKRGDDQDKEIKRAWRKIERSMLRYKISM